MEQSGEWTELQTVLATANELGQILSQEREFPALLRRALEEMADISRAPSGALVLQDEKANRLVTEATRGLPAPVAELDGSIQQAMTTRTAVFVPEGPSVDSGPGWLLVLPLTLGTKLTGLVTLQGPAAHPPTLSVIHLLTVLASQITLVIRNAQLYAWSEELVIAQERNRIARDIHDGVAQSLTLLSLVMDSVADQVDHDPEGARRELNVARDLVKRSLNELRQVIFTLRPVELERVGLVPALQHHVWEFGQRTSLQSTVEILGPKERRLPTKTETALFRVVQEALNNVRKHARCHSVGVVLDLSQERTVSATIRDDGVGFDPAQMMPAEGGKSGLGLVQMRERVQSAGGVLTIESEPGHGTTIRAELPL